MGLSGLPFPSPGDPPWPGIEPTSPALAGGFFTTVPPGEPSEFLRYMEKCVSSNSGSFRPLFVEILVFLFSPLGSPDIYMYYCI